MRLLAVLCGWALIWGLDQNLPQIARIQPFLIESMSIAPQAGLIARLCILYSLVGSYGIPVIIDTDRKFCFQRHIGLIRPRESVDIKYLYYFLKSDLAYRQATAAATGTAQMTVSLKGLRNFMVPFPPLMEQQEIVSQIERVFFASDRLEATMESNLANSDHLRQSILQRAFQGKLVPQDPSDEPASLLLERIKAERIKESPRRSRKSNTNKARLPQ